jgi:protein TonB
MLLTVASVAIMGAVAFAQRDYLLGIIKPAKAVQTGQAAPPPLLDEAALAKAFQAALPKNLPSVPTPGTSVPPRAVRPPAKTLEKTNTLNPPAASDAGGTEIAGALVSVAAAEVPGELSRSAEATAPLGRFFEPNDVDVSPTVARRIEPQLPADLKSRAVNDTVIVRVLVSQTGDPSRVTLLRKSKQGRSLDDAVVAAVTQWRFSPAKRRGEAVSSWYNIGVPLGQSN